MLWKYGSTRSINRSFNIAQVITRIPRRPVTTRGRCASQRIYQRKCWIHTSYAIHVVISPPVVCSPEEAVSHIDSFSRIYVHSTAAIPLTLLNGRTSTLYLEGRNSCNSFIWHLLTGIMNSFGQTS